MPTSRLIAILIFVSFLSTGMLAQEIQKVRAFDGKEVFNAGYPKTLSFRNDKMLLRSTYEYWKKSHLPFNGITKKYLREEVDMPPIAAKWANKYAEENPKKLMLLHLNGEGKSVNDEATFKRYFPGHWVYEKGSIPIQDIQSNQNKIRVKDADPFSMKAYRVHGQDIALEFKPHDIILVKLDKNGNRIWNQYEYASILNIDYEKNEIELKRGQYGSRPQEFSQNDTYIAPIAGDIWGGNLMYYYNFSSSCPLDEKGQSAADVFVGEMKDWFGTGGELENLDGIGFDVNYFEVKHSTWDCNNDGEIDNGFINGKNIWREGDIEFIQKIRDTFGPDFIITADGWRDDMQRAVGILNGMESEGLCRYNDGFRQISRTINQHTYWNIYNTTSRKFSYITSKLRNPADELIADQLRRMGLGLASCLEVAYSPSPNLNVPEMVGGALNQPNWLGQPLGPMRYILGEQEDLLLGEGVRMSENMVRKFDLKDLVHTAENGQLIIKGSAENPREEMLIQGPGLKVDSGDILIFFEAKAIEGFVDLDKSSLIPRKINIKMEGLPDYPEEPMRAHLMYNDLAGFMGTAGYTPLMFYFRNVGAADLKMILEVEEQGAFAIRNLQVFNSPCIIARQFENGVVIVNPSFESVNVNLNQVFSQDLEYSRLNTSAEKGQNLKIKNKTEVTVPSLDALFLLKN